MRMTFSVCTGGQKNSIAPNLMFVRVAKPHVYGAGVFKREVVGEVTEDIHWADLVIISEDAVEVSSFNAISKVKKIE